MFQQVFYQPRSFNLTGLVGISDEAIDMHFKVYAEHVKNTNELNMRLGDFLNDSRVGKVAVASHVELKQRLGCEYNGMILHEYYFGNLTSARSNGPARNSCFRRIVEQSFGDYATWKNDFLGTALIRGVGWAICYQDEATGRVSNHWISLHEFGNLVRFVPLLVLDVWEHAYLLDYKSSDRRSYVDAFFANIDWAVVDRRVGQPSSVPVSAA